MSEKKDKIASARKKLKQFQIKTKKEAPPSESSDVTPRAQTPHSLASSTDTTTPYAHPDTIRHQISLEQSGGEQPPAIINYFTSVQSSFDVPDPYDNASIPPPSEPQPQAHQSLSSLESLNQLSAKIGNLLTANAEPSPAQDGAIVELERRNQELAAGLEAERLKNEELNITIREQNSLIDKLRIELDRLKVETSTKVTMEVGPLQEQLQHYTQTVGILVGEKAELTASLNQYQTVAREKTNECDELQQRLKLSRSRVKELEVELKKAKAAHSSTDFFELKQAREQLVALRQNLDDSEENSAELRQKLSLKAEEIAELKRRLEMTETELGMARLKVEQLSSDDALANDSRLESLSQQAIAKDAQIAELQRMIEQLGAERDQSNAQYQSYVLQLNREVATLGDKILDLTEENGKLVRREESLVHHVGELERQIQQQINRQQANDQIGELGEEERRRFEDEIANLKAKLSNYVENIASQEASRVVEDDKEKKMLEQQLQEKIHAISDLELTVERLQADKPDTAKLISEIENHRVAASRAVSQNVDLKGLLEELQDAYVQVSNDKLELTDKLQAEQHLCREMRSVYTEMEDEVKSLREKLQFKDDEMIRLSHETTELNKQILLHSQELDRLRHYGAQGNGDNLLQIQLQHANETIERLNTRIAQLESPETIPTPPPDAVTAELHREIDLLRQEKDEMLKVINDFRSRRPTIEANNNLEASAGDVEEDNVSTVSSIPAQEAMEKLQARFRRTMDEVAALTEEKQRLEHIIGQLQFETETIGEYITLYQVQRRQLKQKDTERDRQLQQLAVDREKMKTKLIELNELIEQLLRERRTKAVEAAQEAIETNGLVNGGEGEGEERGRLPEEPKKTVETAGRILALLTDIQTVNTSLAAHSEGVENCPCCHGPMKTV